MGADVFKFRDFITIGSISTYWEVFWQWCAQETYEPRVVAIRWDQKLDLLTVMPKNYQKQS